MNNVLLIDKPATWSSFDVVAKIRGALRKKVGGKVKVGHAGTLDPFATGLLIVLTGAETKNQEQYMKLDKEYEATLRLGAVSTTGDPEGTVTERVGVESPSRAEIETTLKSFSGEICQIPPVYSAIKVNGERAYRLARRGETVELKPRKVIIYKLETLEYDWPSLTFRVACSSGTYIRTLGEQIGERLGVGGYLTGLRRTKIGEFKLEDASTIEEVLQLLD